MAKKKSLGAKIFRSLLVIFLVLLAWGSWIAYQNLIKNNVKLDGKKSAFFYVKTNSSYQDLLNSLQNEGIIINLGSFDWLARKLNLDKEFKPGRYRISSKMSNRQIINMIKSGKQEKVSLSFNYTDRTTDQLINKISSKLEITESELETFFSDESKLTEMGFNKETVRALFLPETYELNWNTSLNDLLNLLFANYKKFWTEERKLKANKMNYSETDIITLASIVQCESTIKSEQRKIAGVYLNRIEKKMQLQADPTLIFASGNFKTHRVLNADKKIDSPYNTYKYFGLPPGPICLPYSQAIDAVLNHEKHNYIFFCAKPDLKGYSNFSVTYKEHKKYAYAYQNEMDRRGIKR